MARRLAWPLAVLLVCALAASVDAAVTWRTQSTLSATVGAPPAQFEAGSGATRAHFVSGFALTTNHTGFSGTLVGRAGGAVFVREVATLVNVEGQARNVTLRATQVTNPQVTDLTWTVRNGATTVATLDVRAANPSVSFALPASASYPLDVRVTILPGAGHHNADVAFQVGVSVR